MKEKKLMKFLFKHFFLLVVLHIMNRAELNYYLHKMIIRIKIYIIKERIKENIIKLINLKMKMMMMMNYQKVIMKIVMMKDKKEMKMKKKNNNLLMQLMDSLKEVGLVYGLRKKNLH